MNEILNGRRVTHMKVLLQHLDLPLLGTLLQRVLGQLEDDLDHLQAERRRV